MFSSINLTFKSSGVINVSDIMIESRFSMCVRIIEPKTKLQEKQKRICAYASDLTEILWTLRTCDKIKAR